MRGKKHLVPLFLSLVLLEGLFPPGPPARAGSLCPEIKGSPNPSDPSHVDALFWDVHGCQVPLRHGIGHVPWQPGDFGYEHIASRYAEGTRNHELTSAAVRLWANALVTAGATEDHDFFCYKTQYSIRGGVKRTMKVFVDYKMLDGYKYKGIVTAYWVNGHRDWCT
jgi:hypothetical protein